MRFLQADQVNVYNNMKSTIRRYMPISSGSMKYIGLNVLKGMQFDENAAGGMHNMTVPDVKPPEVRTGLVMSEMG